MKKMQLAGQGGFVLAATIWVLAALTLLVAWLDAATSDTVVLAERQRAELQQDLDEMSTRATLTFMVLTRPLTLEGLQHDSDGTLQLNSTYTGLGDTRFYLEDESNLLSVNMPSMPYFDNFLASLDMPEEDRNLLRLRMVDYIDPDDTQLNGGAERGEYQEEGMPADGLMVSPDEIARVLGFHSLVSATTWAEVRHYMTVRLIASPNVNSMSPDLLKRIFGLDDYQHLELQEALEGRYISSELDLARILNQPDLANWVQLRTAPSKYLRITTWQEGDTRALVSGISLTPYKDDYPWRQDYYFTTRLSESVPGTAAGTQTALFSSSSAVADR